MWSRKCRLLQLWNPSKSWKSFKAWNLHAQWRPKRKKIKSLEIFLHRLRQCELLEDKLATVVQLLTRNLMKCQHSRQNWNFTWKIASDLLLLYRLHKDESFYKEVPLREPTSAFYSRSDFWRIRLDCMIPQKRKIKGLCT